MIRRRWLFIVAWGALFVVALSSGVDILFYVAYLLLFLVGATWWWTRSTDCIPPRPVTAA